MRRLRSEARMDACHRGRMARELPTLDDTQGFAEQRGVTYE
jgi:hypothetical protein